MASLVFRLCDNAPEILRDVCTEKGWKEFEEDEDEDGAWNLWWKSSGFRASDFESCRPWQRLNHFPKSNSITRKDSLARNLRRMKGVYGKILFNFAPLSFNLPNDYRKFVTEYSNGKEKRKSLWICKPADQSRGKGIFLFRNLTDLTYDCATVVQQYIQNPLLIAGYKFDLRLYILVTSFHPLQIYLYHEGIVRFSTEKFDLNSLDNVYSHLTNTSINKLGPCYATDKERIGSGCKWSLSQLRTYFYQHDIKDQLLWQRITSIVVLTLLMQAPEVNRDTNNCFELFGFDILIDANLKPWLLEVNFSPSLGIDCSLDITIKKALLEDTLNAINLKEADNFPCSLNSCITKVDRCNRNQRSLSRTDSNLSSFSVKSKIKTSRRFYAPSRLARGRKSSKCSQEKTEENSSSEHNCLSDKKMSIAEINNHESSLTNSCDSLLDSCGSQFNLSDSLPESVASTSKNSEHFETCLDCQTKKTACQCQVERGLSRANSSMEFKKAYSSSQTSAISKLRDDFKHQDVLPESSVSEDDEFSSDSQLPEEQSSALTTKPTKLPPLKRAIQKTTNFQFVKRSSKIVPYTPDKGKRIQSRTMSRVSLMNCSCVHSSQRWGGGTHRANPDKKIGDYILVFPFNEITEKACTARQINSKTAINEVKKVMQKATTESGKSKKAQKISSVDEKEKLDLVKPFWGFDLV